MYGLGQSLFATASSGIASITGIARRDTTPPRSPRLGPVKSPQRIIGSSGSQVSATSAIFVASERFRAPPNPAQLRATPSPFSRQIADQTQAQVPNDHQTRPIGGPNEITLKRSLNAPAEEKYIALADLVAPLLHDHAFLDAIRGSKPLPISGIEGQNGYTDVNTMRQVWLTILTEVTRSFNYTTACIPSIATFLCEDEAHTVRILNALPQLTVDEMQIIGGADRAAASALDKELYEKYVAPLLSNYIATLCVDIRHYEIIYPKSRWPFVVIELGDFRSTLTLALMLHPEGEESTYRSVVPKHTGFVGIAMNISDPCPDALIADMRRVAATISQGCELYCSLIAAGCRGTRPEFSRLFTAWVLKHCPQLEFSNIFYDRDQNRFVFFATVLSDDLLQQLTDQIPYGDNALPGINIQGVHFRLAKNLDLAQVYSSAPDNIRAPTNQPCFSLAISRKAGREAYSYVPSVYTTICKKLAVEPTSITIMGRVTFPSAGGEWLLFCGSLPHWNLLPAATALTRQFGISTFYRILTGPFGNGPFGRNVDLANVDLPALVSICSEKHAQGEQYTVSDAMSANSGKRTLTFAERLAAAAPPSSRGIGGGPSQNAPKKFRGSNRQPYKVHVCLPHPSSPSKSPPPHSPSIVPPHRPNLAAHRGAMSSLRPNNTRDLYKNNQLRTSATRVTRTTWLTTLRTRYLSRPPHYTRPRRAHQLSRYRRTLHQIHSRRFQIHYLMDHLHRPKPPRPCMYSHTHVHTLFQTCLAVTLSTAPPVPLLGGPTYPAPERTRIASTSNPVIYYEPQYLQFCQLHAFNMLNQQRIATPHDILAWCKNPTGPTPPNWASHFNPTTGNLSQLAMGAWLSSIYNITLTPLPLHPSQVTIPMLDTLLQTVRIDNNYDLPGFMVYTTESEGYHHASALLQDNQGSWLWLDPNNPHRRDLTNPATLLALQTTIYSILALLPSPPAPPPPPPLDTIIRAKQNRPRLQSHPQTHPSLFTPSGITLTTFNALDLRPHLHDLHQVLQTSKPHILFLQETHTASFEEDKLLKDLKPILRRNGYNSHLSCVTTPPISPSTGSYMPPNSKAKGGVALIVSKALSPLLTRHPVPASLDGYVIHTSLPLTLARTLHIVNVYIPPSGTTRATITAFLPALITSLPPDQHFFILGGDFNHHLGPPARQDRSFQSVLTACGLTPINASTTQQLTHYPHNSSARPSMLDDILISSSLLRVTNTAISDLNCPLVPFTQLASDHYPITIHCPNDLFPIQAPASPDAQPDTFPPPVPSLAPPPPPTQKTLIFPIPRNSLNLSRESIVSALSTRCDLLAHDTTRLLAQLEALIPRCPIDPTRLTMPWSACKLALRRHVSTHDLDTLSLRFTGLLEEGLAHMLKTCPTRSTSRSFRVSLTSPRPFYYPRKVQNQLQILHHQRKVITFSRRTLTLYLPTAGPDGLMHTPFSTNLISPNTLIHLSLSHFKPTDHLRPLVAPNNPLNLVKLLPELPPPQAADPTPLWKHWLTECDATLRHIRSHIRSLTSKFTTSHRDRQRLIKSISTTPKVAHRAIFASPPSHIDPTLTSPRIIKVMDPSSKQYLTEPAQIQHLVHKTYCKEWQHDPAVPTFDPYPFQSGILDPFPLTTPAKEHCTASTSLLPYVLRHSTFNTVLRRLKNNKRPGPDGIPHELIRLMPHSFKTSLRHLMIIMWITGHTPAPWKVSSTILLYKKDDPTHLENRRPIGLLNTIYKVWTRFVTEVLSSYSEDYHILSPSQEGFRPSRNTSRHLQRLAHILEDARASHKDIYALYIDFTSAFNTISHAKLYRIMHDLGFPTDSIDVIRSIYTDAHTRIVLNPTTNLMTDPIHVGRGTIQGDTLSPLVFLLFLEPLLRWLTVGGHGYTPSPFTSHPHQTTQSCPAYADDLTVLTTSSRRLKHQFQKICMYCKWGGLSINPKKCAATGILHHQASTGLAPTLPDQTALLRSQLEHTMTINGHEVPFFPPNQPYKYLGVWLSMNLDFRTHFNELIATLQKKGKCLVAANVLPKQALSVLKHCVMKAASYSFAITPFSDSDIRDLDTELARITKACTRIGPSFSAALIRCPVTRGGLGLTSLRSDYISIAAKTFTRAFNDPGDLGLLARHTLQRQIAEHGCLPVPFTRPRGNFHSLPLSIRQLTLLHQADITIHRAHNGMLTLTRGNQMWQDLTTTILPALPHPITLPSHNFLIPLWRVGLPSLTPLLRTHGSHTYIQPSSYLRTILPPTTRTRDIREAQVALNRLTLILTGTPYQQARKHATARPLPDLPPPHPPHSQFRIEAPIHLLLDIRPPSPDPPPSPPAHHFPPPPSPRFHPPIAVQRALDTLVSLPCEPPAALAIPPITLAAVALTAAAPSLAPLLPPPPLDLHLPPLQRQGTWATPPCTPTPIPLMPSPWTTVVALTDQTLIDTHISLSPNPVHPDLDILPPGVFTIQIGLPQTSPDIRTPHTNLSSSPSLSKLSIPTTDRAHVYRPDGTFIGSLSHTRLAWLRFHYDNFSSSQPCLFKQHTSGSFEQDLAALLIRYRPTDKSHDYNGVKEPHWPLADDVRRRLHIGLHATSYHFLNPLTIPIDASITSFSSPHSSDCLFGAYHGTYSRPWSGSSIVCPPFTTAAIKKSLRWAIASATHYDMPCSTLILVPKGFVPRLNYWLSHPFVSILKNINHDAPPFRKDSTLFDPPDHLQHNPTLVSLTARTDMTLLHISNPVCAATLLHAHCIPPLSPADLTHAYSQAAWPTPSGFPPSLPQQPEPMCPAPNALPSLLSLPDLSSLYPPRHPLAWNTHHAYYTDGSSQTINGKILTGAAFYETHQHPNTDVKIHLVHPAGLRETNTITRAELAAIASALTHASLSTRPSITIFTDSLASIYLIIQALHTPRSIYENKHAPILLHIRSLLLTRSHLGRHTHIQKVPSHTGIIGNELADIGATRSVSCDTCDYSLSDIDNQYLASLPAWPCLPPPGGEPDPALDPITSDPEPWYATNLNEAISAHIASIPSIVDGYVNPKQDTTYHTTQATNTISLPHLNNHYFTSSSWHTIRSILKVRNGSYWTASFAHTIRKPYRIASGTHNSPFCPLCSHLSPTSPPLDTAGHILGACPLLSSSIIARHNRAVCLLHRFIRSGSLGGNFTILDATSADSLPSEVFSSRIPPWILPAVDPLTLNRLRPDILIIQGLTHTRFATLRPALESPDPSIATPALRALQRDCMVHIVELGYTSDRSHSSSSTRKRQQHNLLVHYLLAAGWSLPTCPPPASLPVLPHPHAHAATPSPPPPSHLPPVTSPPCLHSPLPPQLTQDLPDLSHHVHVILISTTGVLFQPIDASVSLLGISSAESARLLRGLNLHSVRCAISILKLRRQLESNPLTFANRPVRRLITSRPPPPVDPP